MAKGKTQTSGRTFAKVLYDSTKNLNFTITTQDTNTSFNSAYPATLQADSNAGSSETIRVRTDDTWDLSLYKTVLMEVSFLVEAENAGQAVINAIDGTPTTTELINYNPEDSTQFTYKFIFISAGS